MANLFVQGAASTVTLSTTPYSLAFPGSVTQGNLLVVAWRRTTAGATLTNVTGTLNTAAWTVVYETSDGSTTTGGFAYTFSTATGAETVRVNFSANVGGGVVCIGEWSGVNSARTPFPAAAVASTSTPTSNAITAVAGDLIVGVAESNLSQTSITAGSGYVIRETGSSGGVFFVGVEDNLNAAGGSTTASFTGTASGGTTAGIGAFFFNPALAGTGSTAPNAGPLGLLSQLHQLKKL